MVADSTVETAKKKNKQDWWKTPRARMTFWIVGGLAIVSAIAWWIFFRPFVSTDDARIAATFVRVAPESIGGRVTRLAVQEGDRVKKGDVLAELDPRMADAQLQRAKAKVLLTSRELRRISELVAQKGLAPKELDTAKANADTAEADLKLAEVAQENTAIRSPVDGIVVQKSTEEGNIIAPGQTVVTVVDIDHAWVAANIEETSVGAVKVGQPVRISVDEGGSLTGKVMEVRSSVASQFALIPSDNGAGNYTKVVQRVPIKIALDAHPELPVRAGQSVEIKIRVH